ncbi:hypothetical protein [Spongiimicrobium salis]|uniref:hypothetical protein n=1 Tax=Spongiimicrobium salis TaxID=1667022 RepID=UPI00374DD4A1
MKNVFILAITFFTFCKNYSQSNINNDSILGFNYIYKDSIRLAQKNINSSIYLFDDSGRMLVIWRERRKYRAKRVHYKLSPLKSKGKRIGKFQKLNAKRLLETPPLVQVVNDKFCSAESDYFNKVYIYIYNKNQSIRHSFFSHCVDEEILRKAEILNIYYCLSVDKRE